MMNMRRNALAAAVALAGAMAPLAVGATTPPPQPSYQILGQKVALDIAKGGSYTKTVSRVLQPLTLAGVEEISQVQITYPANFASVKILEAYTETPTHKRIDVTPAAIFTQSTDSALRAPFLSDGTIKNLIFPAVTPGSTVHLKYVEHFDRAYMPGIYAVSATLAPYVLARSVTLSVTAPKSMPLYFHARGNWIEHRSDGPHDTTLRATGKWLYVNFPPQKTAAVTQYAPMAVIGTARDWKAVARAYEQLAISSLQPTPAIREAAAKAAGGAHGEAAVAAIYHWMQQHIQAVNVDYREAGYQPPRATSTLARGIGDSNASVALLCSMLRAKGIDAIPALISTSARYVAYPGADPFAFEHVLAYVPAYHLYLDTSQRYAGINALPLMDAGKPVLLTSRKGGLVRTPGPARKRVQYHVAQTMTLNSNGVIDGTTRITSAGWHAILTREYVLNDRIGDRLQRFMQNGYYAGGRTGAVQVDEIDNRDDLDKPLSVTLHWRDSDAAIPGKQVALVVPTPGTISNALSPYISQATRKYPSVLRPETIDEVARLRLPIGMRPADLPKDQHLDTPSGSYSVSYHFANGTLVEERRLHLKQFVVDSQQYPKLHELALMAVGAARKGILLRREE